MLRYSFDKGFILGWFRKSYVMIVLSLIYIPLLFIVALSFTGVSPKGNIILDFHNPNAENWENLFQDGDFVSSLLNSIAVAAFVTPVSVIIGIFTCFGMWKSKTKTKKIIKAFSTTNISIPDIITGISLTLLFATIWIPFGLDYGYWTIVISHISFTTPYAIITIFPRMASLKQNLINASNDLGASKSRTFFKVVIPHIMPAIISACVIVIAISFDDFVITLLVSGNFRNVSTSIYLSSKGIKAWIVTFGAILVLLFIFGSALIATFKIVSNKKGNGVNKKWVLK